MDGPNIKRLAEVWGYSSYMKAREEKPLLLQLSQARLRGLLPTSLQNVAKGVWHLEQLSGKTSSCSLHIAVCYGKCIELVTSNWVVLPCKANAPAFSLTLKSHIEYWLIKLRPPAPPPLQKYCHIFEMLKKNTCCPLLYGYGSLKQRITCLFNWFRSYNKIASKGCVGGLNV